MASPDPREYIVNVGPQGTFRRSGNFQTSPEDIDQLFARFRQQQVEKIALYFHGGLVSERSGLGSAARVETYLRQAGAAPVCFVWETGLIETIAGNITKVAETKLFNKLLKLVIKKIIRQLGFDSPQARGIAGPGLSDEQIELELNQPDPFSEYNRSAGRENARTAVNAEQVNIPVLEIELSQEVELTVVSDPEFAALLRDTAMPAAAGNNAVGRGPISIAIFVKHIVKIIIRVIRRFQQKRDHDLYPTIVEEILREFYIAEAGAWIWKGMKDKARDMWTSNNGRTCLNQYAGRYFLDLLAAYKKDLPETRISLVGHSAGSIAISYLLRTTAQLAQPFSYDHILLLAPACRIELFRDEILAHPDRYQRLRLFTMTDEYECRDKLVPFIYTHSLLYLVSGLLEEGEDNFDSHILGLQRHTSSLKPYDTEELQQVHAYLTEAGMDREALSVTLENAAEGLRCHAKKHGAFDEELLTLQSIQYILQQ
ncbi:MAG: hypothetical protein P0Y53_19830 [Candidatus Pseudobacter hemicellulosilyticus]|uniref:Alpha/beta hydrolase n=1 Tax=Candidatus Pseudobacter hemicellulosilyticus TaxID=3121375 RepID=A0AAJ5WS80_9BACT|nr:MAG: hypothetical protein P0Y53_19830 [Pseudobacter sp.]